MTALTSKAHLAIGVVSLKIPRTAMFFITSLLTSTTKATYEKLWYGCIFLLIKSILSKMESLESLVVGSRLHSKGLAKARI